MFIPNEIKELGRLVDDKGGRLFVVGGAIRDHVMGIVPEDFDLLMTGLDKDVAIRLMNNPKKVIGNAPVFKWRGIDVALGRREINTGDGKQGFDFIADPNITIFEDLIRRDFTVNAMAIDVVTGELIDPFDGLSDIRDRILRPVSPAFVESDERVLRGASFAARLEGFVMSDSFWDFAEQMSPDTIAPEQVFRHFEKGMKLGVKPSRWIEVLDEAGWLEQLFPELHALKFCEQDSEWHPEIWALEHTMHVLDESEGILMRLAAICHDLGKIHCTVIVDGKITSPRHEKHIAPTIEFLDHVGCFETDIRETVISLVREHMIHSNFKNSQKPSKRAVRRLSQRLRPATIEQLSELVRADVSGRPPLPKHMPESMIDILEIAKREDVTIKPFEPMMQGRHLIKLGMKPSKQFGIWLKQAEEAEIDGVFDNIDDGMDFLRSLIFD